MAGGGGGSGFGPGLWIIDSEKLLQGEYWTNRYIVAAPSLAEASAMGNAIVGIERAITHTSVLFTKYRASDGQPDTDIYQVYNVNDFGARVVSGEMLALFNVARFDFNVAGGGRPSRKYMRGCLVESDVNFNALAVATITNFNADFATPMAALAGYVDIDGQEISDGQVYPFLAMRQLRRGSKRKAPASGTPV